MAIVLSTLLPVGAKSLVEVWKKNLFCGRSSKKPLERGYYKELARKIHFRKTEVKISNGILLSLFLSLFKVSVIAQGATIFSRALLLKSNPVIKPAFAERSQTQLSIKYQHYFHDTELGQHKCHRRLQ